MVSVVMHLRWTLYLCWWKPQENSQSLAIFFFCKMKLFLHYKKILCLNWTFFYEKKTLFHSWYLVTFRTFNIKMHFFIKKISESDLITLLLFSDLKGLGSADLKPLHFQRDLLNLLFPTSSTEILNNFCCIINLY